MITFAIHTKEYANALKRKLGYNNIEVVLDADSELKSNNSQIVKVLIDEKDLLAALKIIESGSLSPELEHRKLTGKSNVVLIPVDFSDISFIAVRAGFELAERLSLFPLLLHAFASPNIEDNFSQSDSVVDYTPSDIAINDVIIEQSIENSARSLMNNLVEVIKKHQADGSIPNIKFSTSLKEGIAEDVIIDFSRQTPPALIVMANRGKHKRQREMIGSVTAEVIDSCRVPVFTVPENYSFCGVRNIVRLAFFCNLDDNDMLSFDLLMKMFGYPSVSVWLIPVNDKASNIDAKLASLADFFKRNYPTVNFSTAHLLKDSFASDFEHLLLANDLQMIIVPNKKKNILSRLFNPGIAHKILYEKDIPMLALPV